MKPILVHRRGDIPEYDLKNFFPVSKTELREVGVVVPDFCPDIYYLDNENFKYFIELKNKHQQIFHKEEIDKNTDFLRGSKEYNDYYYPKEEIDKNTDFLRGSKEYNDYYYPKIDKSGKQR